MKTVRVLLGATGFLVGLAALFAFDFVKAHVLFLSGDRVIEPYSYLQLRILMMSAGAASLCLIFAKTIRHLLREYGDVISRWSPLKFLTVTLGAAIILRLLVLLFLPVMLRSDSLAYHEFAVQLAQIGSFNESGLPTAYWPPAYPWLLSRVYLLFGVHPIAGAIANLMLSLGIVLLGYLVTQEILGESVGRVTGTILAIFPSQALFLDLLMSEFLFTVLLLAAVYIVVAKKKIGGPALLWLFFAGCLLGLATLTRNLVLYYPVMLIPFWLAAGHSVKKTAIQFLIVTAGLLVVVSPWVVRNLHEIGTASITTNGGVNFYIGNHPGSGIGWSEPDPNILRLHDPTLETHNDSLGYALGRAYIGEDPLRFLAFGVGKVAYTFAVDLDPVVYGVIDAASEGRTDEYVILAGLAQTAYLVLLLAAIPGLLICCSRRIIQDHPGVLILLGMILYWTAVHFVFFGSGRFHFPLIPAFAALAAFYIVGNNRK